MAYNRKIKVGSDTISSLKSMGMKEAVRYANSLIGTKGNAEIIEGARRLYGSRVKATSAMPKATSPDAARKASASSAPAKYKSVDAARMGTASSSASKPKKTSAPKPTNYVAGSRDPRVNAAAAREAIAKGSGKKITLGKGGSLTNKSGTYIDVRANAARARAEAGKPKTAAQIAAAKAKKVAAERAARQRSANRGYSNR